MRALLLAPAVLAWALYPPTPAASADALTLDDAVRLALARQPLLDAQDARVRAAQARAVAAGELPDPQLVAGFDNVSVENPNPYAADAEPMTMTTLGLMQEFPNAAKRRERARRERLMAEAAGAEREVLGRGVGREAALAWVDAWQPQAALALVAALASETQRQRESAEIAFRSGRGSQSALQAATVAAALIEDRERQLRQSADAARARLARWIGEAATRPPAEPRQAALPPLAEALARLDAHPELRLELRSAEAAGAAVALARAAYRPDWRIQAMYGYRRPYDDMVGVQIGIDLPLFTQRRQDRELEAALAEREAAEAGADDRRRALAAAAESAWREAAALDARLAAYGDTLLPAAEARREAALAAWRSGSGSLDEVLAARSAILDIRLMQLELQAERLRQQVQLQYLTATPAAGMATLTPPSAAADGPPLSPLRVERGASVASRPSQPTEISS